MDHHPTVRRPWGTFTVLEEGLCYKIKKIVVDPGQRLSLQKHKHRAEHWVVVEGTAQITCEDKTYSLVANESTYISPGFKHRLENPGQEPLSIIEVQTGSYVGEDDIERFEDVYGRK
ncbi:MAG: cupin domain-containing protein [Deltaproteobacteria bacterium]|nr:MAG: cupin domain-containing protein [Deltaproteobacteria bacterium]